MVSSNRQATLAQTAAEVIARSDREVSEYIVPHSLYEAVGPQGAHIAQQFNISVYHPCRMLVSSGASHGTI